MILFVYHQNNITSNDIHCAISVLERCENFIFLKKRFSEVIPELYLFEVIFCS